MSGTAIKVENLGKKYLIRHEKKESYQTFQDVLIHGSKKIIASLNPFDQSSGNEDETTEEFWALNDVNFEINKGDKVGIIGRNGAGKSTLLKVLSRITEPTTGKIHINGRIASLLEVGTGFHPELTGRENIYLNGAILGMSRKEIKSKFDEIVAFAEVEKFLDTPVKRYSSGMYVRLAFSVAAHLEPEILVVDEVLAVGDVEFQKKCLSKMSQVSKEGRTILFVSHNMNAVEQLCDQAILMKNGKLIQQSSSVRDIIHNYISANSLSHQMSYWINKKNEYENEYFSPTYFAIVDFSYNPLSASIKNNEDAYILVKGKVQKHDRALSIGYVIYDEVNNIIYHSTSKDMEESKNIDIQIGDNALISKIPKRFLNESAYRAELLIFIPNIIMLTEPGKSAPSIFFNIKGGLSDSAYWYAKRPGILAPVLPWDTINLGSCDD